MKVLLLAPTPPPTGGISGWTARMLNATLKNGWKVDVIDEKVSVKRGLFGDNDKKNIFDEIKRCFRIWSDLHKKIKNPEVTVVHSCIPSYTTSMLREYICACITKTHKKKFIIHFRCTVPNSVKGKISRLLLKKICKKSDLIILLNQQSVDFVKEMTLTPIVRIPNFVDASEIASEKAIADTIGSVIYVGGVIETKGCCDIVKVAQAFPNITFYMVGTSDRIVEEIASQVPNVVLTGAMDKHKVKEMLKKADVFIFLSYFLGEGFSNALLEAMAMGLPCIVTDWAANTDMIENKGGIVVKVHDIEAVVSALHEMQDPRLRLSQSHANIAKVSSEYVDTVVIDKYVDAYESLLE